jgi:hypothetical protein
VAELLLEAGANPNARTIWDRPLIYTNPIPGAAKFLLNCPPRTQYYHSIWGVIPGKNQRLSSVFPTNLSLITPEMVQQQFLLQQWCDIGEMLVERGPIGDHSS